MLYWTLVVISIFQVKLLEYFILFCLVDFCTTIIGEINMVNNVDEHPIGLPPIWHHEKLIRLKLCVMQLQLLYITLVCPLLDNF